MKSTLSLLLVIISFITTLSAQESDKKAPVDEGVKPDLWIDGNKSLEEYKKEHKGENLLILFGADWCPTCKMVEAQFAQLQILKIAKDKKLTLVYFDCTEQETVGMKELVKLENKSLPQLLLFTKEGVVITPEVKDLLVAEKLAQLLKKSFNKTSTKEK